MDIGIYIRGSSLWGQSEMSTTVYYNRLLSKTNHCLKNKNKLSSFWGKQPAEINLTLKYFFRSISHKRRIHFFLEMTAKKKVVCGQKYATTVY